MHVRVLFFGMLKDITGMPEERLELADGATIGDVFGAYVERFPRLGELRKSIVPARNHEFSKPEAELRGGDEVAFLPPVSGGTGEYTQLLSEGGDIYGITRHEIQTRKLAAAVLRGGVGAVVTFEGVVRNNTKGRATRFLDYEGYEEMAVKKMADIGAALRLEFAIDHVAMVHRVGRLMIGEASVVVIVTAAHRKAAFDACLEGLNRLKKTVPIWKKEYFTDGEVWVEGEVPGA